MLRILWRLWLALLLIGGAAGVQAQTFPKFTGLVVDDANVLPPETRAELTQKLTALQKDTKRQLVVATIGDLQGYPLEDYGNRLLRTWAVGLKGADNGAILFIAPNNPAGQRGPRLEVGYGLEPILTDAFSSTVTRGLMTPMLRNGDIPGAMTAGTDAVIAQLRASPEEAQAKVDAAVKQFNQQHRRQRSGGGFPVAGVFMLIVFGVIVASIFSGRRKRRAAGPWGRRHRSSDSGVMPIILWSIADEIARNATRGSGWGGGGGSWGGGSSDGGSDGSWGGGGFTGGGGGSGGGGGASGDW
ncbi:TPM domain-containing protein [Sphingomonas sp. VNH70]|uniref:TPM domain-containing protein n=1 Tax=Sphingomonas silueang TaxID=3156617 RepID=UPI0032B332C6